MKKLTDTLLWCLATGGTAALIAVTYPFFILKNMGYYLRAPSVLLYAVIFFFLDRITKLAILANTSELPIPVLKNFFTLTFVKNPGVAFGWFPDWKLPPILMALIMIVIITYYSFQLPPREKLTRWSLALLVGGAIGNLYDRVAYSYVVDFFLFHIGKYDFPVFNVADIAIDLGVFLLFVDIFLLSQDEEQSETAGTDPAPLVA
ncbi:MAG TPA: signal peptidase II [Candidatus Ozemobacteraceae bacterium]